MKINYVEGDLFVGLKTVADNARVFVPHVCNDIGQFGKGFAAALKKAFPVAEKAYKEAGPHYFLGNNHYAIVTEKRNIIVCHMIAQHKTINQLHGRRLRYNSLATCMDKLADSIIFPVAGEGGKDHSIVCPLFGAGLAGGDWSFIEQLIIDCWCMKNIPVTVYYMAGTLPAHWSPPKQESE